VAALYALPNGVIPSGTVHCTQTIGNGANELTGWSVGYDADHPFGSAHAYKITYPMAFWEVFSGYSSNPNVVLDNSAGGNKANPLDTAAIAAAYAGNMVVASTSGTAANPFFPISSGTSSKLLSGSIYKLKFTGNPGVFKQPEIVTYLDGNTRPTLASPISPTVQKTITKVWTDGQQGEYNDYHADHCDGVTATIRYSLLDPPYGAGSSPYDAVAIKTAFSYLAGLTVAEARLLKTCLGDADGVLTNNVDVYNWDTGDALHPHFIKLVRSVTTYQDGGYYAALIWDDSAACPDGSGAAVGTDLHGCFKLLNPFTPPDGLLTDVYEIYTTQGVLAQATSTHRAVFNFGSPYIVTVNDRADAQLTATPLSIMTDTGDVSCHSGVGSVCINKGDLITVLAPVETGFNPPRINLYTANKLAVNSPSYDASVYYDGTVNTFPALSGNTGANAFTNVITTDLSVNWGNSFDGESQFKIYKFTPAAASTYSYVAECSNRGICDRTSGTCNCFSGYTNEACFEQNSLAL
jgi:hypothetical protein